MVKNKSNEYHKTLYQVVLTCGKTFYVNAIHQSDACNKVLGSYSIFKKIFENPQIKNVKTFAPDPSNNIYYIY